MLLCQIYEKPVVSLLNFTRQNTNCIVEAHFWPLDISEIQELSTA